MGQTKFSWRSSLIYYILGKKTLSILEKIVLRVFYRINPQNETNTETRLLRADYHGAYITVTRSKCPSLIGISGIVIQETRNVFKIITRNDRLKSKYICKIYNTFTILPWTGILLK